MSTATKTDHLGQWVRILTKGLVTIPKSFREELGIQEGEVARIKRVGRRLIIEPREVADYELYSDRQLKEMLKEDKLPTELAREAASFWPDLK